MGSIKIGMSRGRPIYGLNLRDWTPGNLWTHRLTMTRLSQECGQIQVRCAIVRLIN